MAAPQPEAPPVPEALYVTPEAFGAVTARTPPSTGGVATMLPSVYETVARGDVVEIRLGEALIAEVFPTADGTRIERIASRHPHVVFPWDAQVGLPLSNLKHWSRMACALGSGAQQGQAVCKAYKAGRLTYVVEDWPGAPDRIPEREEMASARVASLVWTPTKGDAE